MNCILDGQAYEQQGNIDAAIAIYKKGLDYLFKSMKCETDEKKRALLTVALDKHMAHTEKLTLQKQQKPQLHSQIVHNHFMAPELQSKSQLQHSTPQASPIGSAPRIPSRLHIQQQTPHGVSNLSNSPPSTPREISDVKIPRNVSDTPSQTRAELSTSSSTGQHSQAIELRNSGQQLGLDQSLEALTLGSTSRNIPSQPTNVRLIWISFCTWVL